jgi:hypothetical protein
MDRPRGRLRLSRLALALACACATSGADDPAEAGTPLGIAPVERTTFRIAQPVPDTPAWRASLGQPLATSSLPAPADWSTLLAAVAADDPVPACRLAVLLEDCRLAGQVEVMIETELSMAEREGRAPESVATDVLALQASGAEAEAACGAAPPELLAHEWNYLLRAALAGHEASMYRFITDLPIDPAWPDESAAALAAWRRHAPEILSALLQRHSPESLMLAYRAAQGFAILGDRPLQARDARAAARLGSALEIVHEDDPALAVELAALARELQPAQQWRARKDGERLAEGFLVAASDGPGTSGEECESGWPGMQATWTAYGYQSGQ